MGWKKADVKVALQYSLIRTKKLIPSKVAAVERRKKEVIALLQQHKEELARIKTELFIKEKRQSEGYQILEIYLEQILARLDYLSTQRIVPPDMIESIGGVVFCSRLGDIQYLPEVRKQISRQFGSKLVDQIDAGDETLVNARLKMKFSVIPPDRELVLQEMQTLAHENNIPFNTADTIAAAWGELANDSTAPPETDPIGGTAPTEISVPTTENPSVYPPQINPTPGVIQPQIPPNTNYPPQIPPSTNYQQPIPPTTQIPGAYPPTPAYTPMQPQVPSSSSSVQPPVYTPYATPTPSKEDPPSSFPTPSFNYGLPQYPPIGGNIPGSQFDPAGSNAKASDDDDELQRRLNSLLSQNTPGTNNGPYQFSFDPSSSSVDAPEPPS